MVGIAGTLCVLAQLAAGDTALDKARQANMRRMVQELSPRVAKLFDARNKEVRFQIVSRDVATRKLEQLIKARPRVEAERLQAAFGLLHLVQVDAMGRHQALGHGYQIAGFYDPQGKLLYVVDDEPNARKQKIVAHELAHAFQDRQIDLLRWASVPTVDVQLARKAVTEGQAEVAAKKVMEAEAKEAMEDDLGAQNLPGSNDDLGQHGIDAVNFAYVAGADFIRAEASEADPLALKVLKRPPASTAQVMDSKLYERNEAPRTGNIGLAKLTGGKRYLEQSLGRAVLDILGRERHLGTGFGEGWTGDRLEVVQLVDERAAAWAISFRDVARAREFAYGYGSLLGMPPEGDTIRVVQQDGTVSSVSSAEGVVAVLEHMPKKYVKAVEAATLAAFKH
jgi:hypothetical protein